MRNGGRHLPYPKSAPRFGNKFVPPFSVVINMNYCMQSSVRHHAQAAAAPVRCSTKWLHVAELTCCSSSNGTRAVKAPLMGPMRAPTLDNITSLDV